jgi:hypothetical protein
MGKKNYTVEQIKQLRASLREFGFVNPCIIDKDYNIIAGHGRVMAAKEEGISEIPCVFAKHLTDAQEYAYILADNRLTLNAGWDDEMLSMELSDLQANAVGLSLFGFCDAEMNILRGGMGNAKDVRSKVEYVFLIIKRLFHCRKIRYRGLAKNRTHAFILGACANLYRLAQSGWRMGGCVG